MQEPQLRIAIARAGGVTAVAQRIGVSHQAVSQWRQCPPRRVIELERLSGISRTALRPDIYPPEDARPAAAAGERGEGAGGKGKIACLRNLNSVIKSAWPRSAQSHVPR